MIKFRTESGSVYTLYSDRWESTSANTRTKGGELISHSGVVVGAPVLMVGPGLVVGTRLIETTPVVEILEEVPDGQSQVPVL